MNKVLLGFNVILSVLVIVLALGLFCTFEKTKMMECRMSYFLHEADYCSDQDYVYGLIDELSIRLDQELDRISDDFLQEADYYPHQEYMYELIFELEDRIEALERCR